MVVVLSNFKSLAGGEELAVRPLLQHNDCSTSLWLYESWTSLCGTYSRGCRPGTQIHQISTDLMSHIKLSPWSTHQMSLDLSTYLASAPSETPYLDSYPDWFVKEMKICRGLTSVPHAHAPQVFPRSSKRLASQACFRQCPQDLVTPLGCSHIPWFKRCSKQEHSEFVATLWY